MRPSGPMGLILQVRKGRGSGEGGSVWAGIPQMAEGTLVIGLRETRPALPVPSAGRAPRLLQQRDPPLLQGLAEAPSQASSSSAPREWMTEQSTDEPSV